MNQVAAATPHLQQAENLFGDQVWFADLYNFFIDFHVISQPLII